MTPKYCQECCAQNQEKDLSSASCGRKTKPTNRTKQIYELPGWEVRRTKWVSLTTKVYCCCLLVVLPVLHSKNFTHSSVFCSFPPASHGGSLSSHILLLKFFDLPFSLTDLYVCMVILYHPKYSSPYKWLLFNNFNFFCSSNFPHHSLTYLQILEMTLWTSLRAKGQNATYRSSTENTPKFCN